MVFLKEKQCFFLSLEFGTFTKSWCPTHMKALSAKQYIVQRVTQFSLKNKVLGPPDSTIDNFLPRYTVLLPLSWIELFGTKWCSSHFKALRDRKHSFEILSQFSLLLKVLNSDACNINGSLTGGTLLLPFTWKGLFCTQIMFFTL
jgi:hypothetical protein